MRLLLIGSVLLILGTAGLWLLLSRTPPAPVVDETGVAEESAGEASKREAELDTGGEFLASAEDSGEIVAREGIAPPPTTTATAEPERPSAPLRGVLRDSGTQEVLPDFLLAFEDSAGRRVEATTDAQGKFETTGALSAGRLRVIPIDDAKRRAKPTPLEQELVLKDGAFPDLALEVRCGPTYRLSLAPAGAFEVHDLDAWLRVASEERRNTTPPDPVRADPAHEGGAPWVRFAPIGYEFDRADAIEVRSRDGVWVGEAPASTVRGTAPGFVAVTLEARAVLAGRVVNEAGDPVRDASITLDGTSLAARPLQRRASTDRDGRYRFEFLRAGNGTVTARSLYFEKQEAPVLLPAKETAKCDFSLVALPPAGAIRGIIRSETGTYTPRVSVTLNSADPARTFNSISVEPSWETVEGRKVGKFEFLALPAGRYQLDLQKNDWLKWEPARLNVSPPIDNATFVVHDDLSLADFVLHVSDTDNGSVLESFWWSTDLGGRNDRMRNDGAVVFSRLPLERGFHWRIDHQGYRPETGDERDFSVQEIQDGKIVRIANVGLRPGWGDEFRVIRRTNNRPIEGAKILLDGREAGVTRADGTVTIHAPRKPDKVEVAWQDWRVAGSIDLRPAWQRQNKRQILVAMTPPPPAKKNKP